MQLEKISIQHKKLIGKQMDNLKLFLYMHLLIKLILQQEMDIFKMLSLVSGKHKDMLKDVLTWLGA
jgi:hypothetical protein